MAERHLVRAATAAAVVEGIENDKTSAHERTCATERCASRGDRSAVDDERSAVSTAASTSETITSADEDVHCYEDWELGFDAERTSSAEASSRDGGSAAASARSDSNNHDDDEAAPSVDEMPLLAISNASRDVEGQASDIESPRSEASSGASESEDWSSESESAVGDDMAQDSQQEESDDDNDAASDGSGDTADGPPASARDETHDVQDTDVCSPSLPPSSRASSARSVTPDQAHREPDDRPTQQRIQVFVRVRPLSARNNETNDDAAPVVRLGTEPHTIRVQAPSHYTSVTTTGPAAAPNCVVTECRFDRVFLDTSSQDDVFAAVEPSILATLDGYNATVFAYGQTGTGKTHTIFGDDSSSSDASSDGTGVSSAVKPSWGVIPRALALLLARAHAHRTTGVRTTVYCSFLQIYNDRLFDLLTDRRRQRPVLIREQPTLDGTTSVVLQGLSSERVETLDDALQLLRRGRTNRSVRETELNACSSRSHAIVQLNLTIERTDAAGETLVRRARLNLVDLAGSEKWNTDVAMDDAHSSELKMINASLSALGNCIAALCEVGRKHIPYRDSTLTRVLQDSLGGNTQACLIATVSPSARAVDETIRTLQFADRARSVLQSVRVNSESLSGVSELAIAKAQIAKLRERLASEQRHRHQTRVKEHEAEQRAFNETLARKEQEIAKLARDNAVFARWREDDVQRIRELELRVKELEGAARPGRRESDERRVVEPSAGEEPASQVNYPVTRARPLDRKSATPPPPQLPLPTPTKTATSAMPLLGTNNVGIRKLASRKAITASASASALTTAAPAAKKSDVHAAKPYRMILERYALGSKKAQRSQQHWQQDEDESDRRVRTRSPHAQSLERLDKSAKPQHMFVNGDATGRESNQRLHDNQIVRTDAPSARDVGQRLEVVKSESSPLLRVPHAPEPSMHEHAPEMDLYASAKIIRGTHALEVLRPSMAAPSVWKTSDVSYGIVAPSPLRQDANGSSSTAVWRSAHLIDQTPYRSALHPFPVSSTESLQLQANPEPSSKFSLSNGALRLRTDPEAPIVSANASATATTTSKSAAPWPFPSTLGPSSSSTAEACAKHSLRGCVLCAAQGSRPSFSLSQSSSSSLGLVTTTPSASAPVAATSSGLKAGPSAPCARHHLTTCFICGASNSSASLSQSSITPLATASTAFKHATSSQSDNATLTTDKTASTSDVKCAAHALANCVLCAGSKTPKSSLLDSPVRRSFASDVSSNAVWTSSENGTGSVRSPALDLSASLTRQQQQHASSARRHSIESSFVETSSPSVSSSPLKHAAQLRSQQSAPDVRSQLPMLGSSGFVSSPVAGLAQYSSGGASALSNESIYSALPAGRPSWQQQQQEHATAVARASIKELAHDISRHQYDTLIRSAADAAASALRRNG